MGVDVVSPPGWGSPFTLKRSLISSSLELSARVELTLNFDGYYWYDGIMRSGGVPIATFLDNLRYAEIAPRPYGRVVFSRIVDAESNTIAFNPSRGAGSSEDLSPLTFHLILNGSLSSFSAITAIEQYANGNVYATTTTVNSDSFQAIDGVFGVNFPSPKPPCVRSPRVVLTSNLPTPERPGWSFYCPSFRFVVDASDVRNIVVRSYWKDSSIPKTVWECSTPIVTSVSVENGVLSYAADTLTATLPAGTGES